MKKVKLGNSGLSVTEVGFGVLTVGPWQLDLPVNKGASVLRYALEKGINFIDTAQYYKTYPYIKEALIGFNKELILASKSLVYSYNEMKDAVEEARVEMDRDVIDIFLMHEVREGSDWNDRKGAWEYLLEAKSKGLVKAIGVSTHHVEIADRAADEPEVDILFPLINIDGLGIRKGTDAGSREEMEKAIEKAYFADKGVFAMKVFGGGTLTTKYQEAFRYVNNLKGIDSMMIGFGSNEEVDRIFEMVEGTIDPDYAPDMSKKKVRIDHGDCSGCGNCINRCPNHALYFNADGLADVNHEVCLTCGYCAPVCPYMAIIMY